jgi:hypothetical protein
MIFTLLLNTDPQYKKYFLKEITDQFNHRITQKYLLARVAYYKQLAMNYGDLPLDCFKIYKEYMLKRPDFIIKNVLKTYRAS